MLKNAFNTPRLCMITGDIKPLGQLKATPRETQLFAKNNAQREKIVLVVTPSRTFKVTAETWAVKQLEMAL